MMYRFLMGLRNASVVLLRMLVIGPVWLIGFILERTGFTVAFLWNYSMYYLQQFIEWLVWILPEPKKLPKD